MIEQIIRATQGKGMINTAYIERLNATFRQRLACLFRRTRHLARHQMTLQASMYVLGCVYNFCDFHKSLRLRLSVGWHGFRWVQRTPALAAHLTDHCWSLEELFTTKTPPPPWIKNRVAAGCLIVYFFGCLVMLFDHFLLRSYQFHIGHFQ
jgi:hypothetical protein